MSVFIFLSFFFRVFSQVLWFCFVLVRVEFFAGLVRVTSLVMRARYLDESSSCGARNVNRVLLWRTTVSASS